MEREEVRSEMSSERRDSVHSDWSELIPVNRKVEYKRLCNNTNEPTGVARATTSATDDAETILKPSAPPAKKTIKYSVSTSYTQTKGLGKLAYKITICHKPYC